MKRPWWLSVSIWALAAAGAHAHPGSGIVVDAKGNVFVSDINRGLLRFSPGGEVTVVLKEAGHWLALDAGDRFGRMDFEASDHWPRWFKHRKPPGTDLALISDGGSPLIIHGDGNLYYACNDERMVPGGLQIGRLSPDGKLSLVAPGMRSRVDELGGIKGLAAGPDGSIYVACPGAVLKVKLDGTFVIVKQPIPAPDCDRYLPPDTPPAHEPFLTGLAVSPGGDIYLAATGCRCVLKLDPKGMTSTVLKAEPPWSPTAVALVGEDLYVAEWTNAHSEAHDFRPRVRKVGRDGGVTTLATVPETDVAPSANAPSSRGSGPPSAQPTRVPSVLRQGAVPAPQAVSAVDVLDDGRVAVCTMAFRHDRNFWLLSPEGQPLWGRQVAPWAPMQVESSAGGGSFGVGMAYSRVTSPQPTISIFAGEKGDETEVVDSLGEVGWLRYGSGDWRTGWVPSLIGDLVARAGDSVITVRGHNGGVRAGRAGQLEKSAFPYARLFRLAPSPDGSALAFGFIVPVDGAASALPWSKHLVSVHEATGLVEQWSVDPAADLPLPPPLPEPLRDFPELAEGFGLKPERPVPCRVAASVSPASRASRVAVAEYGGWIHLRKGPVTGTWDPPYHAIPFVPRQQGTLRLLEAPHKESARVSLPREGLFEVRVDPAGRIVWAYPASWFARGMAGAAWLPADPEARHVHTFDVAAGAWGRPRELPDAVSDLALHSDGERAWVSCWDGNLYLIHRDGRAATRVDAGSPARVRWSPDGSFAVAGTEAGEVIRLDPAGTMGWRTRIPVTAPLPLEGSLKPVFEGVPVWAVGRTGPEHAYVGDTWLVKSGAEGLLIDAGGTSAIPLTLEKIRAAGVDPSRVRHLLHTHTHGDHAGGAYLWRAMGLSIVAPESAALATTWLMPTVSDYGVWVPRPVDVPLPLKRVGDETRFTAQGLDIRAVFVPGHSYDSVVYLTDLGGKRVAFTGDLGFKGQDILHRSWGDADKAAAVTEVVRTKVLGFRPDIVFTGHDAHENGMAFLEELVAQSLESIRKARAR